MSCGAHSGVWLEAGGAPGCIDIPIVPKLSFRPEQDSFIVLRSGET
jgi:hypothetical protein